MSHAAVPRHIAIIPDGNRRWAKNRGVPTLEGHQKGAENFETIARAAFERGVEVVSYFGFSTENWSRTSEEVGYLMKLAMRYATKEVDKFHAEGVRFVWLGVHDNLDTALVNALHDAEAKTAANTKGTVAMCFNYGGQRELAEAMRRIMSRGIAPEAVTPEVIESALDHPELPPIDLMIRTSGERRISNYQLWRLAYAELYFTEDHWPDFSDAHLDAAIAAFAGRERRFGGGH